MHHAKSTKDEEQFVQLERVNLSDDEEDDNFDYAAVDLSEAAVFADEDDEEEDFEAVLRNLNKRTGNSPEKRTTVGANTTDGANDKFSSVLPASHVPKGEILGSSGIAINTQVRPSVVDDFIRNFLVKIGMARTLEMFNNEWYELMAKGKLKEDDIGVVPDIYMRNQALDDQVKDLRKQLEETKKITEKARGTWDKFRHQRDVHRMHHQRVLQEKDALVLKIRKLDKHVAAYEPLLNEMKSKYETAMKEKMLMRLERDRQAAKVEALESQLKDSGGKSVVSSGGGGPSALSNSAKSSSNGSSAPPSNASRTSSNSNASSGTSSKSKKKHETKLPTEDCVNPFIDKHFEPVICDHVELAKTFKAHDSAIAAVAFHPKNQIVATASDDESWKLWSVPNGELIMSGEGHRSWLANIEFHPRGTHVATSSGDNTIKLWDFVSASCSQTLTDHSHPIWESVFHHEGDFLVSASMDHTCKLWDLATGKCRKTFRGHVDSVNSVCFQPFTCNICTASGDKTVSIWDLRSGLCVQTFYGHQNACNSVCFSLAGDTIASCDADGFVKLWDVRMVAERNTLDGGKHPLNSVVFDRSGKVLFAGSDDGTIKAFDVKVPTPALGKELKGHEGPVQCVKIDPAGRFMVSSSSDCTFRLWSCG